MDLIRCSELLDDCCCDHLRGRRAGTQTMLQNARRLCLFKSKSVQVVKETDGTWSQCFLLLTCFLWADRLKNCVNFDPEKAECVQHHSVHAPLAAACEAPSTSLGYCRRTERCDCGPAQARVPRRRCKAGSSKSNQCIALLYSLKSGGGGFAHKSVFW